MTEVVTQKVLPPFGSRVLDRLSLLHPKMWWKAYQTLSNFLPKDIELATHSFFGMMLPAITWGIVHHLLITSPVTTDTPPPLLLGVATLYMLSPWTLTCGNNFRKGVGKPGKVVIDFTTKRALTLPDAHQVLKDQLEQGRAYRRRRYDVYLPSSSKNNNTTKGVILLPGALVEHTAYSSIAKELSDRGLLVVVVSCEPTRLANFLSAEQLRRIQNQVQHQLSSNAGGVVSEWTICGHSAGAKRAVELGVELEFPKIVMWGFPYYSLPSFSKLDDNDEQQRLFLVQGGNDQFVSQVNEKQNREYKESFHAFTKSLPRNAKQTVIQGGSHKGFGSYTPQFLYGLPEEDIEMSIAEQHTKVADLTAKFVWKD